MALLKRLTSTLFPGLRLRSKEQKWAKRMKARQKVFDSDLWSQDSDFAQRNYGSYDDYVKHQSSKLDRCAWARASEPRSWPSTSSAISPSGSTSIRAPTMSTS
jgi:hypothetical protein